ncbi:unnamed protein product [Periconia digitata]|uniref:Uncharacterized protein n=1 Tax=Periconia digitata TaxID=1303443 RepID=A0A9W4U2S7_9PLEO|nr:unnamed protein product [Periconia digitata]
MSDHEAERRDEIEVIELSSDSEEYDETEEEPHNPSAYTTERPVPFPLKNGEPINETTKIRRFYNVLNSMKRIPYTVDRPPNGFSFNNWHGDFNHATKYGVFPGDEEIPDYEANNSERKRRCRAHAILIEHGYGVEAEVPCGRCESQGKRCLVYHPHLGFSLSHQDAPSFHSQFGFRCSGCRTGSSEKTGCKAHWTATEGLEDVRYIDH